MERRKIKGLFYKFILLAVLTVVSILSLPDSYLSTIALEQESRCNLEEHIHSESCYLGEVLLCRQKAHTHGENCYLLLLANNDINWLLQTVGETREKSLAGIVDSVMGQALTLNDNFANSTPPVTLSSGDISSLNTTIEENNIVPSVTLNENLSAGTTLAYTPDNGGISTLDVGDSPSTGSRAINFYMMLDGRITLVSSGTLTNNNPRRYNYADTASAYNKYAITALTSTNIGSRRTYRIYYNIKGNVSSVSDFETEAAYSNNNSYMTFGNGDKVRYALLTNSSKQAIQFYTVTLDYSQVDGSKSPDRQYVESGQRSTLTLSGEYLWVTEDGTPVSALPSPITATTTLYARPKAYTATFVDGGGAQLAPPYSATPDNGALSVPMPSLAGTAYEGYYWIVQGSDGQTYYPSNGAAQATITGDTVFEPVPSTYTVIIQDETGAQTTQTVGYRQTITLPSLPADFYWYDNAGTRYQSGATYGPVTQNVTFTAATVPLRVTYNVNFPSSAANEVDSVPTLYGTTSSTATDLVTGSSTVTRTLTSRVARDEISSGNKESRTYYFKGWTVDGTDVLIPPDSTLTREQLMLYAGSSDTVTLKGVWENGTRYNSATFFVRFDSQAVDTNGNITSQPTENYTPEIFNTHVGGVDTSWSDSEIKKAYEIADTTSDNSFGADSKIRALYGERSEGLWLYDFPKDDDVFAYLIDYLEKNPTRQLSVEGEPVNPEELDRSHYAIRWYVFKLEGSTWHADGKLVRKYGTITVDKTFGGDTEVLAAAKEGFHIVTENGTRDENGVFTPHDTRHKAFRQIILTLDQATADALKATYPLAQFHIVDIEDLQKDIHEWQITDITLDEIWRITEQPTYVPGSSYYAEYSVYDTDGSYSAIAEYGTQASVVGRVFALDEDPDQGLLVDFANYYYKEDSILLKKEDAKTGRGLSGAVFEMWQNGRALCFYYDEDTGIYTQSPDATDTRIQTTADGFAVINGFSYLHGDSTGDGTRDGDITIKEILPPAGYDKAPDAELGLDESGNVILKSVTGIPTEEWPKYAAVPSNEIAVIRDHTSEYISVTVDKVWNTTAPADSVEVVLQANGANAAALFPGMTNAQVRLHAGNLWTYTWTDLPRYANGKMVEWGVKEVVVGGMPTLSDGVSFANWIVTYSPAAGTDNDGDGDIDRWSFTVTNATRRPQLIVTKVGDGSVVLPGAEFTLEQVQLSGGSWQPVSGTATITMTSNERGMLTFDQLMAGSYYRLTEVHPPEGYIALAEPIILSVNGEGLVQQAADDGTLSDLSNPYITYTGPYNLRVVNMKLTTLPSTGGVGTNVYWQSGTLLMLIAAVLFLYKEKRRREATDSS